MAREKSDSEYGSLWSARALSTFDRGFDLRKRQSRVIQKDFPSFCERDAPRLPVQQFHTDLGLKIADLPAERRL